MSESQLFVQAPVKRFDLYFSLAAAPLTSPWRKEDKNTSPCWREGPVQTRVQLRELTTEDAAGSGGEKGHEQTKPDRLSTSHSDPPAWSHLKDWHLKLHDILYILNSCQQNWNRAKQIFPPLPVIFPKLDQFRTIIFFNNPGVASRETSGAEGLLKVRNTGIQRTHQPNN